jgi:hypothetical protein
VIPWNEILPPAVLLSVGGMVAMLRRHFKDEAKHQAKIEKSEQRNCVHHGVIFDHMGITRETVRKAEAVAGLGPKR